MMSFVTAKNVSTKNPRLMYPAHENRSTISSSNPLERKTIGMIGSIARITIEDHVMILKGWLRFKKWNDPLNAYYSMNRDENDCF